MAKLKDGLLGKLSGKIGNIVVASWKGIPYIRSKPSGNPSNTKAQQNQRTKFGIVVKFVGRILPVIKAGFKWRVDEMPERNAAISYLMKNGVCGEKPHLSIDYPQVVIARGNLPPPKGATVKRIEEQQLSFRWNYLPESHSNDKNDKVIALAYAADLKQGVWQIGDGANRSDGMMRLKLPEAIAKQSVHVYLAFANTAGSDASDSVYLGNL